MGKYRLRTPKTIDKSKTYPIELEYTWNRQVLRKSANIFVKAADWNQNGNQGRGEIRSSYVKHPNQITAEVIAGFLSHKPLTRKDQGKDFAEFVLERLESEYSRHKIGRSRYKNGICCMNVFTTFLRATNQGTYEKDKIYVGDITPELIDGYITWRRDIRQNGDETINHSLTPILKACSYAAELGMIEQSVNARIQDMMIVTKPSLSDEESEFDGKALTKEQMDALLEAFHACGLRIVDVMTLQWGHINFEKKELRKIMIKTSKRHVIPLTEPALKILRKWQEKRVGCRYVFDLVNDNLDLNDEEALYKARINATKCIGQSLAVVGEQLEFPFSLSMHVARHSFAVMALNKGLSMSVVSRLLGHGSTDITEKVYAHFLPETLSAEMDKLHDDLVELEPF